MKRLLTLATAIGMLTALPTAALAQNETVEESDVVELHHADYGVGALWARGSGTANLAVEFGAVALRVTGDITVTGGIELAVIDGERSAPGEDGIRRQGFDGLVYVHGTDMDISANGEIRLHGMGNGQAELSGQGVWKTLHRKGVWRGSITNDIAS